MTRLAVPLVVYRETRSHSLPSSCWTPSFWPTANRSQVPVTFYYARSWWVLPRHLLPMPFGRRFSGEAIFSIRDVWVRGRRWHQSHACLRLCGRPQRELAVDQVADKHAFTWFGQCADHVSNTKRRIDMDSALWFLSRMFRLVASAHSHLSKL